MAPLRPPPELMPLIDAFAADPDVTVGPAMSSLCLKVRGRIFAMVNRGRLVVKLPKQKVDLLEALGEGERFDRGAGPPMKEWVAVPPEKREGWLALARQARAFVGGEGRPAP